mmetsp:Transcript_36838/g.97398  ORF Transcript_36838/g.97398 Transcript_36838/m.97398 type:complete len:297 (+) Transcript_36838:283-1173(+)
MLSSHRFALLDTPPRARCGMPSSRAAGGVIVSDEEVAVVARLVVWRHILVDVVKHDLGDALDPRLRRRLLGSQDVELTRRADLKAVGEGVVDETLSQRLGDLDGDVVLGERDLGLHEVDRLAADALLERVDEACVWLEMDNVLGRKQDEVLKLPLRLLLLLRLLARRRLGLDEVDDLDQQMARVRDVVVLKHLRRVGDLVHQVLRLRPVGASRRRASRRRAAAAACWRVRIDAEDGRRRDGGAEIGEEAVEEADLILPHAVRLLVLLHRLLDDRLGPLRDVDRERRLVIRVDRRAL